MCILSAPLSVRRTWVVLEVGERLLNVTYPDFHVGKHKPTCYERRQSPVRIFSRTRESRNMGCRVDRHKMYNGSEAIGMHNIREVIIGLAISRILLFHVIDLSQNVLRFVAFSVLIDEAGYPRCECSHFNELSDHCIVTSL